MISFPVAIFTGTPYYSENVIRNNCVVAEEHCHLMHEEPEFWTTQKRPRLCGPVRYKLPDDVSKHDRHLHLIIHTRDPRDVLVSMYYSYGWTHAPPEGNATAASEFVEFQQSIRNMTIDQFALGFVDDQVQWMIYLNSLLKSPPTRPSYVLISSYMRMVERFTKWNRNICQFLHVGYNQTLQMESQFDEEMRKTRKRMRKPLNIEGSQAVPNAHVRDGSSGQYLKKLKPETIDQLNDRLEDLLHEYDVLSSGYVHA